MECVIDTSVLISLFRGQNPNLRNVIDDLIENERAATCGQVWVEFIGGYGNEQRRRLYADKLAAYTWLPTTRKVHELAAELFATHKGVGSGDAIIAATVIANGASLLTLDDDFKLLKKSGLKLERIS